MVERLCCAYGTPLLTSITADAAAGQTEAGAPSGAPAAPGTGMVSEFGEECSAAAAAAGAPRSGEGDMALFAFPTLQQLKAVTEEALRADGFGYR